MQVDTDWINDSDFLAENLTGDQKFNDEIVEDSLVICAFTKATRMIFQIPQNSSICYSQDIQANQEPRRNCFG